MDIVEVSDIYKLTNKLIRNLKWEWSKKGYGEIDLVCGGPPCQGFSGIGHRRTFRLSKRDIPSNHLFLEMIRVIEEIQPKIFLFENVKGLLNSRWTPNGQKGEIWKAVLTAFRKIPGYNIRWDLIHSKDYGVPQNRPRVLMVGLRDEIYFRSIKRGVMNPSIEEAPAVDAGFLPSGADTPPSIPELLSDLEDPEFERKTATPAIYVIQKVKFKSTSGQEEMADS